MKYSDFFEIENGENKFFLKIILKEILNVFEQLGIEYDNQQRVIFGNIPCPRFCIKEDNPIPFDQIHLTMSNYTCWCQIIYQLSHELTHCFIHCHNNNRSFYASWIEETICESMSLFFLAYFRDHWNESELYEVNENYSTSIADYLDDIIFSRGNNRLSDCKNQDELMEINKTSQEQREDRKNEMIELYQMLVSDDIKGLICYRDHIVQGKKILDTKKYRSAYPNNAAVKYLCDLQDNIINFGGRVDDNAGNER